MTWLEQQLEVSHDTAAMYANAAYPLVAIDRSNVAPRINGYIPARVFRTNVSVTSEHTKGEA